MKTTMTIRPRKQQRQQLYLLPPLTTTSINNKNDIIEDIESSKRSEKTKQRTTIAIYVTSILFVLLTIEICIFVNHRSMVSNNRIIETTTIPTDHEKISTTTMKIYFNITFDELSCVDVNVHSMDVTGRQVFDTHDTVIKTSLNLDGTPKIDPSSISSSEYSEYSDEDDSHATTPIVVPIPKNITIGEGGCNIAGYLNYNRVGGNFHIAMGEGSSFRSPNPDGNKLSIDKHKHIFYPNDRPNYHISHTIHYLHLENNTFTAGDGDSSSSSSSSTSGIGNGGGGGGGTLDGTRFVVNELNGTTGVMRYNLTVTPITTTHLKTTNHHHHNNNNNKRRGIFMIRRNRNRVNNNNNNNVNAAVESNRYTLNNKDFIPLFNTTTFPINELQGQPLKMNNILPGVYFIVTMNPISEIVAVDETTTQTQKQTPFGISNIFRILVMTFALLLIILIIDEILCCGTRRRMIDKYQRKQTRSRILAVV